MINILKKIKKLILDLLPKKNYKVYYKNLEYYLKLEAKVTKAHRILTFDEKPFLKQYIDLNTELRKQSKNDLEKDLFKLINNAIFGKSMENVLNRSNIKLINNNPEKLLKLIKQPNFQNAYEVSNRLCLVESKPIKTVFNKPIELNGKIITEFCVLKPKMYSYEYIDNYTILNDNKHKGIKTVVDLKRNEKKRALYKEELIYKEFYNLQLNKQKLYLDRINKIALNPFDSKRHWVDNINSVPYGYNI